ncbi:hypothetical protein B0T11DRAFT_349857 [Plectosphaerella cucumerina]|uniref:Uncharacterized protein n=1 Tax=Plectosphaerella cucumerina TaxID=40658 RepID=A0A8K0X7V8_9PEZI|nr:hypothetical protein B0T11DRAFT_349857 [Plectosphaerella cucumerina]
MATPAQYRDWVKNMDKASTAPRKSGTAHFEPNPRLALNPDGIYDKKDLDYRVRLAWEATKSSYFYKKLEFPDKETRWIDQTVSCGIISNSEVKKGISNSHIQFMPQSDKLLRKDPASFLLMQLALVPLGCPVKLALDRLAITYGQSSVCAFTVANCHVIRDVVALANGMEATSEYTRDWLEPQDTKVTKRKASVHVDEANKRAKTCNMDADTEMNSKNPLEAHDQSSGETGIEDGANTGTDTDTEYDTVSNTSCEKSVESAKSVRYARMTQPRGFRLMQYYQAPYASGEREKMIEAILNITEKPTDADIKAKMPARLVLTGDQNEEFLLRMYDARKRKIEQEHSHAIKTHGERVRIAAVVRRVYQSLDHTAGHLDWNCRQIESGMKEILDDIATMREEIMTLRSENVGFRAEIRLLKAATNSS